MEPAPVPPDQLERSPIEKLPVEIKQEILGHVPDLASLSSAIRSCTSLNNAYEGHKCEIVHKILTNQTNPYLRFETLAAGQAALFKPWTAEATLAFFREYWNWRFRAKYAIPRLELWKGRLISDLYVNIRYFADDFVKYTLANHPTERCGPDAGMWAPTRKEINRIERTFYRFQTYCDIFGDPDERPLNSWRQQDAYFRRHAPWENEQLACVHQYLTDKIMPLFCELAEKNRDWITYFSIMNEGIYLNCIDFHLCKGLNHVRTILDAPSLQDRLEVLGSPFQAKRSEFLHDLLRISTTQDYYSVQNIFIRGINNFSKSTVCDPDLGPSQAWTWCQTFPGRHLIKDEWPVPLRRWGYVMWDHRRLDAWRVLLRPFQGYDARTYLNEKVQRRQDDRKAIRDRSDVLLEIGEWRMDNA